MFYKTISISPFAIFVCLAFVVFKSFLQKYFHPVCDLQIVYLSILFFLPRCLSLFIYFVVSFHSPFSINNSIQSLNSLIKFGQYSGYGRKERTQLSSRSMILNSCEVCRYHDRDGGLLLLYESVNCSLQINQHRYVIL